MSLSKKEISILATLQYYPRGLGVMAGNVSPTTIRLYNGLEKRKFLKSIKETIQTSRGIKTYKTYFLTTEGKRELFRS